MAYKLSKKTKEKGQFLLETYVDDGTRTEGTKYDKARAVLGTNELFDSEKEYEFSDKNGNVIGVVSHDAKEAIEKNKLDSYKPKNDEEKRVIDSLVGESQNKKEKKTNNNSVFKRYNINPDKFEFSDFLKWADEHNYKTKDLNSPDAVNYSPTNYSITPKYEGGFLGIGGKKMTTEQEDKDMEFLRKFTIGKTNNLANKVVDATLYTAKELVKNPAKTGTYLIDKASAGATGVLENTIKVVEAVPDWTISKMARLVGADDFANRLEQNVKDVWDRETYAEQQSKRADEEINDDKVKFVGNIVENAGALVPAIATEVATAGVSPALDTQIASLVGGKTFKALSKVTNTKAGKILSNMTKPSQLVFQSGVFGSSASNAYRETGDVDKAMAYGALTAIAEGFTEQIFGGFAGTDMGGSLIDFPITNKTTRKVINMLTEGAEEVIMAYGDTGIKRITGVDKNASLPTAKEVIESGVSGILLSGLMSAATYPVNKSQTKKIANSLNVITNALNTEISDEKLKFVPLDKNASEKEIIERQGEIEDFAKEYASALSGILTDPKTKTISTTNAGEKLSSLREEVIKTGLESPKSSEAYKNAKTLSKKKNVSDYDLGKQYLLNVEQVSQETTEVKTRFAPGGATENIISLEKSMTREGVAEKDIEKIVSDAVTLESSLAKTPTTNMTAEMVERANGTITTQAKNNLAMNGAKNADYWGIYGTNLEVLSKSDKTIDEGFIDTYADAYAEGLKEGNSISYHSLAENTDNVAKTLKNYVLTGAVPESMRGTNIVEKAGENLKGIIQSAVGSLSSAHKIVYGEGTNIARQAEAIKSGDFSSVISGESNNYKTTPSFNNAINTDEIRMVMNSTFKEGAMENIAEIMSAKTGGVDMGVFAYKLAEYYQKNGNIGPFRGFFADGGIAVAKTFENMARANQTVTAKEKTAPPKISILDMEDMESETATEDVTKNAENETGEVEKSAEAEKEEAKNEIKEDKKTKEKESVPEKEEEKAKNNSGKALKRLGQKGKAAYQKVLEIEQSMHSEMSEYEVLREFEKSYRAGREGVKNTDGTRLTEQSRKVAEKAGKADRKNKSTAKENVSKKSEERVWQPKKSTEKTVEKESVSETKEPKSEKTIDNRESIEVQGKGTIKWSSLHPRQQKAIVFMEGFAKAANMKLVFVANSPNFDGAYDISGDTMYLDIYAGVDPMNKLSDIIIPTASHELTHWMHYQAPVLWNKLSGAVFSALEEVDGINRADRINSEIERLKGKGLVHNELVAEDEIVARACEDMLAQSEMGKKVFESLSETEQKTITSKIKDILTNLKNWISDFLSSYKPSNRIEAEKIRQAQDKVNEILKLWNEGIAKSVEVSKAETKAEAFIGNYVYEQYGVQFDADQNSDEMLLSEKDNKITVDDVKNIQSIGRKSVNDFTSEDISKTKKIARKYFEEMGVKSPFFRAWFGDWRVNDKTPVHIVTEKGAERGTTKNKDTNWDIQISGKVFNETKGHKAPNNTNAILYLDYINSIVENAILLDSYTIEDGKAKSENSAMMHSMYAVADIGNGLELIKLYVEELNDVNSNGTIKRSYQLQNLNKIPLESKRFSNNSLASSDQRYGYSVSDLYAFVKSVDKNFNPKSVSKVVNEDGTPKVVYHQTSEDISIFDTKHEGAGTSDGETPFGIFMKPTLDDIGLKGKKQIPLYAEIVNPLDVQNREELVEKAKKLSSEYEKVYEERKNLDNEYRKKVDDIGKKISEYMVEWRRKNPDASRTALYDDVRYVELSDSEDTIIETWENSGKELDRKMKIVLTEVLVDAGYDGVHLLKDEGSFGRTTETWIAFDSNQVKSATDNIGTFDKNNPDIRYSEKESLHVTEQEDADYMAAVKKGDMETAQKMVDEEAKKARFPTKVYHGTNKFGFTKNDVSKSDDGISFFATDSLDLASTYSGVMGETSIKNGNSNNAENQQRYAGLVKSFVDTVNEVAGTEILTNKSVPFDKYLNRVKKGKMNSEQLSQAMTEYTADVIEQIEEHTQLSQETDSHIWDISTELEVALYGLNGAAGNYGLYANTDNFLEVEGNGSQWSSIPFDKIPSKTTANTREIAKWAKDNGYSGVLFKDIYDIGYHGKTQKQSANVYAFFSPQEQTKSADPVTYNAFGRIIPLSKRFNAENKDIRYSEADTKRKPKYSVASKKVTKTPEQIYRMQNRDIIQFIRDEYDKSEKFMPRIEDVKKSANKLGKGYTGEKNLAYEFGKLYKEVKAAIAYGERTDATEQEIKRKWDEVQSKIDDIAMDIVMNNEVKNDENWQMIKDFRRYLHGRTIKVPAEWHADFDAQGGIDGFRKHNRGRFFVSYTKGESIETLYPEMRGMFGNLLPDISNPADQLIAISDFLDEMAVTFENPYDSDIEAAAESMSLEIMADMLVNIREVGDDVRSKRIEKLHRVLQEERLKKYHALNRVKERQERKIREATEKRKASAEKKADMAARQRLLAVAKKLESLAKKSDAEKQAEIQKLIGHLDLAAVSITDKKLEKLKDIKNFYDGMKNDPDFIEDKRIEKTLERLEKKQISDLDLYDVQELTDVLLAIEHKIRTDAYAIETEDKRKISVQAKETMRNIKNSSGSKASGIGKFADNLIVGVLTPTREARRITGYVDNDPLYLGMKNMQSGQVDMFDYAMKAEKMFEKYTNDKKFMESITGAKAKTYTYNITEKDAKGREIGKRKIELTAGTRISLLLHNLNSSNQGHMKIGGVTIPDAKLYKAGKMQEAYARGQKIYLHPSDIKMITKDITEKEREYARVVWRYYNEFAKSEINRVSLKLKGYEIARVKNYFPIDTNKDFSKQDFELMNIDGTIEGMGFLKERIEAKNPIMLIDVASVLEKSIRMNSKYVGLAIPVRNMSLLLGKSFSEYGEATSTEKQVYGLNYTMEKGYYGSVMDTIGTKWGTNGKNYINKIMQDMQGKTNEQGPVAKVVEKIGSRYVRGILSLNLKVAFNQVASIPSAIPEVGYKALARSLFDFGRVNTDLIAEYTPLQYMRSKGAYDTTIADMTRAKKGILATVDNVVDKVDLMTWTDTLMTRKLWKAATYNIKHTRSDLKEGTREFYEAVAEVYVDIMQNTQPNVSMMERPQYLRSDPVTKMLMAFKGEPFKNVNLIYESAGNLRAKARQLKQIQNNQTATSKEIAEAEERLKQANNQFVTTAVSQVVATLVYGIEASIFQLIYGKIDDYWDDEEEKVTFESWLVGVLKDSAINTVTQLPFANYVVDIIGSLNGGRYYSPYTPPALDSVDTATKSIPALVSAAQDIMSGKINLQQFGFKAYDAIEDVSTFLGIPTANVIKNIKPVIKGVIKSSISNEYLREYAVLKTESAIAEKKENNKGEIVTKGSSEAFDILYRAMENGDQKAYNTIVKDLQDRGVSYTDIESAMQNRAKKDENFNLDTSLNMYAGVEERGETEKYEKYIDSAEELGIDEELLKKVVDAANSKKKYKERKTDAEKIINGASLDFESEEFLKNIIADSYSVNDLSKEQYIEYSKTRATYLQKVDNEIDSEGMSEREFRKVYNKASDLAEEYALSEASDGEYSMRAKWMYYAVDAEEEVGMTTGEFLKAYEEYGSTIYSTPSLITHEVGYDVSDYLEFRKLTKDIKGDKDENGKDIEGRTKQDKIINVLDNMNVSNEVKAYLYSTEYKSNKNNPWSSEIKVNYKEYTGSN